MRKSFRFIFVSIMTVFVSCQIVFAEAPESGRIGVAAGITGVVKAVSLAGEERILDSGDPVFEGDTVTTGENSRMQILLLDQTVFTIGPSSEIRLDEFSYDPSTHEGKLNADILKGVYRFISGMIAHQKPEHMTVDLPVGTIGIRGTFVAGQSNGERSLVVLLGPDAGEGGEGGRIFVSNVIDGQDVGVEISEKGFGTVIEGTNFAPIPPFRVSDTDLYPIMNALNYSSSGVSGEPGTGSTSSTFDPADMAQTFTLMSQMQEYGHKAAQGGMLTLPQPVVPSMPGGRDEDGDSGS
jgi:hypothetical protein